LRKLLFLACVILVALFVVFQAKVNGPGSRRPPPGRNEAWKEWVTEKETGASAESGMTVPNLPRFPISYQFDLSRPCSGRCAGTAFAVEPAGVWLTARHVVESCRRVYLRAAAPQPVSRVLLHPSADVAIILTPHLGPSLGLDPSRLRDEQAGFHIGYPGGQPGSVFSRLLGRTDARRGSAWGAGEPVIAWAEVARAPARQGSLGGISGGAVIDGTGEVVGVTIAEEPRRGRVISAAPESLFELLASAGITPAARGSSPVQEIDGGDFGERGNRLRREGTVVQVVCEAGA